MTDLIPPESYKSLTPEEHKTLSNLLQRLYCNCRFDFIDTEEFVIEVHFGRDDNAKVLLEEFNMNFLMDTIKPRIEGYLDL